jgi:Flp pilus assembly protein TadD
MTAIFNRETRRRLAPVLLLLAGVALGACEGRSARLSSDGLTTGSTSPPSFKAVTALGKKWEANPGNAEIGVAYAAGLEGLGQTDQQLAVLKTVADANPGNAAVQALYGKKLVSAGRSGEAIPVLERAIAGGADWRAYSALGSAYDQQQRYAQARDNYNKALQLKPNEISVLNNIGMSYILEGNLKEAEATLRKAMTLPTGRNAAQIRQNLALAVGLQGRFDEARKIASEDLPPDQIEANMAYLQKMLARPNTWQQLSEGEADQSG